MDQHAQGTELTDTAAAWLVALDAGTADRAAFEGWRDADVRHAIAFAEVAATWRALDGVRALRPLQQQAPPPPPPRRHPRRAILRGAIGTGVVAAMGGGFAYSAYARERAVTDVGERRTIRIDDQLTVDLNTDSILYWRIGGDRPMLWLDRGEAAIDCRSDATPVELRTSAGRFVLGSGSFNARLGGAACTLTVLEGSGTGNGRTARTGQRLLLAGGTARIEPGDDAAIDRLRGWRQGVLVLEGDRLDAALAEYNRYLRDKIRIGEPGLAGLRIGGRFSNGDVREFLAAMRASFGIAARRDANGTIILVTA
ncbi:hypothetical protein ASG37_03350 [Sphingomonas sp. Leaf407]|uniref:FecR family protein n=1 Tax=unclassified Sphingomonas TaxID=196159 RepID=UPI0006F25BB1|nr:MULTISPECIES: FecR domain-containing protein [unclassified Sphingomonas]KQN40818.1 hypothetical protein ASE97_03375 [Sphingomonas sp. Leaf42]KQT30173.1 hypothetical protein ASG37_03350 [Sphingomonas sp. Leaf407]